MTRLTIIGYGNPLRGDDGLGWFVANRLAERIASDEINDDVKVMALNQLTPDLAVEISSSDFLIFVDACCDLAPGHISCRTITPQADSSMATSHQLDPPSLLAFTEILYGALPETTILLTVGGKSFGYVEGLSPTVRAVMPVIERILEEYINKNNNPGIGVSMKNRT